MSEDEKSTNKPTIDKPMTDTTKEQEMDKSVEEKASSTPSPKVANAVSNKEAAGKIDKQDSNQPKTEEPKAGEKPKKKSKLGVFILILIVFLIAFFGGGYLAYYYLDTQNTERSQAQTMSLSKDFDAIEQQLSALDLANQTAQRSQRSLQNSLVAFQSESERQMQALAQRISSSESTGSADWTLAEVEYLLNIANQRLATSQDSATAIQMLEQADSILFELAYPELTPVRRQISEDLTALRLSKKVDTEGLYFELDSFSNQIGALTDFAPEFIEHNEYSEIEADIWYQKIWGSIVTTFYKFVRFDTEMGEPVYLVTDGQATSRQLGIQLQLRQAQLALLSGKQSVYKGALSSAANALSRYYANSEQATVMSNRLSELSGITVQADEMNINGSIRTLSSVVDQLAKAVNPAASE